MKNIKKEKSSGSHLFYLIFALIVMFIGIIFALQNPIETKIVFLFWEFKGSLALVLFITFFMGIVIGIFSFIGKLFQKEKIIHKQVKEIEKLMDSLGKMEN